MDVQFGILVGGRATRMGGAPKTLLPAPDTGEPLAARLARLCGEALPGARVVLVGVAPGHDALGLPVLADAPSDIGPLGGLVALLADAARGGTEHAVALAGDLPFVTPELVLRLLAHAPDADAVAPRVGELWQPLFARYRAAPCLETAIALAARGRRALHGVLDALGPRAAVLPLGADEARLLDDWDTPEDRGSGT